MSKVVRSAMVWPSGELVERIRDRVGHPATIRELMRVLAIPGEDRHRFRRRITQLVEAGELIRIRGNRYGLPDRMQLVVGRLQVNPRGFGFVTPEHAEKGAGEDIFVAGVNLHQAMHGDRVAIRLNLRGGGQRVGSYGCSSASTRTSSADTMWTSPASGSCCRSTIA